METRHGYTLGAARGEDCPALTPDGAWCFFADPRAVYYAGKHQKTYIGWLTHKGDVVVGSYDHRTGRIDTAVLKEELQKDDHANPSLYIDADGYLTVYYSAHDGAEMFYRKAELQEDIRSWGPEQTLRVNTEGRYGFTYPTPFYLKKEDQFTLFWRGGDYKPNFSMRKPDGEWAGARTLIMGSGARPYIKFVSNGEDVIYFAFTDGHPNAEPFNSIYCAYYSNGAIYRIGGTLVKSLSSLPLSPSDADKVYDAKTEGGKAWIWDIALDEQGYPVLVYVVFMSDTDHRYRYSRWNGTAWIHQEITPGGSWFPETKPGTAESEPYYSGGIILDHQNPSRVFLSRPIQGVFEIEQWDTPDQGRTWTSRPITANSARNNVRPFVSRGYRDGNAILLWMHGSYTHWTDYDTSLKYVLLKE